MTAEEGNLVAFANLMNLASESVGARYVDCSDDFFAGAENLVKDEGAIFDAERFTERGKWMDGWESRRKRVPGHDFCVVRLGVDGVIGGVDIDTSHFLGNHAPYASIQATRMPSDASAEQLAKDAVWVEILEEVPLRSGSHNLFSVSSDASWSHVRLHIYPDGGVARLRVYGRPARDVDIPEGDDLAALVVGGRALGWSDHFFGSAHHLLLPGDAANMGGGWETRRRRGPGHDWAIIELGKTGWIDSCVVDTKHFKGNFPSHCSLEGIDWPGATLTGLEASPDWESLVDEQALQADTAHVLDPLAANGPYTHLRLSIFPCGGVSRLRIQGRPISDQPEKDPWLTKLNGADEQDAISMLKACCGATRWVDGMLKSRPFVSRAHLQGEASRIWWHLAESDWLEAFEHHPEIGADPELLKEKFPETANASAAEQSGVAGATPQVLAELARANTEYKERYGFLFIVCATGKSAEEMLGCVQGRLDNSPFDEVRIAAGEQEKITRLRLLKMEDGE